MAFFIWVPTESPYPQTSRYTAQGLLIHLVRPPPRLLDVDLAAKVFNDPSRKHNSLTVVLAEKLAASS